jgi:exosortase D (VPLPA-CTERM-specific)
MSGLSAPDAPTRYRFTAVQLIAFAAAALVLAVVFWDTFPFLYGTWQRDEYSHGFLIPLISAFLLWQRRDDFVGRPFEGSWMGVIVVLLGLALYFLGSLASITTVDTYALVVVIAGCLLAVMGGKAFKPALVPVALLFLMNPIPNFFYYNLSSQLQLISSQLGVAVIRLFGISVYLEGNVIDLGSYQLQVVQACSGLNYLFPLMTLGVLVACLFQGKLWMRWLIVLSTVPVTVLMNSFRIGVIGVLVDHYGAAQAEGFLHDFEGWVVFMACFALLLLEVWLMVRLAGDQRPFREIFSLNVPARPRQETAAERRQLGWPALGVLLALLLAAYPAASLPQRDEVSPARTAFADFPMQIAQWRGRQARLESIYLDFLKLDDYVVADYVKPGAGAINLYAAYYASQRSGQSAHSPRSCLPGGGWRMTEFDRHVVAGVAVRGEPLGVNRVVIQQGSSRQLVYYWFQQRGRDITNEYLVKWYLFWDALTRNRSDGALVRLITPLREGEDPEAGDVRLTDFAAGMVPLLGNYIPE